MRYNWQLPDWPNFSFESAPLEKLLLDFEKKAGRLGGLTIGLTSQEKEEALVDVAVTEAIKTSGIEGELLDREDVRSSVIKNLGIVPDKRTVRDKRAVGAAGLTVKVRQDFAALLTEDTLFDWHRTLMQGTGGIELGAWRMSTEPMQVVSGIIGKEEVHFQAPPAERVPSEMAQFIGWYNETGPKGNLPIAAGPIRAALAHLYFESIHPFEDGNGRIGRAISEKALFQTVGEPLLLSLSRTIEADRARYYNTLMQAQRTNHVTAWVVYFTHVLLDSAEHAEKQIRFTLRKVRFLDTYREQINARQLQCLMRMLEAGIEGFEGGMTASKYMAITKTSKATATRDLQELETLGALAAMGGGRSTRYDLKMKS